MHSLDIGKEDRLVRVAGDSYAAIDHGTCQKPAHLERQGEPANLPDRANCEVAMQWAQPKTPLQPPHLQRQPRNCETGYLRVRGLESGMQLSLVSAKHVEPPKPMKHVHGWLEMELVGKSTSKHDLWE
jgi:hypothetical protein